MKKILLTFFFTSLICFNSVVAYANDYPDGKLFGSWLQDGRTCIGRLETSTMSGSDKQLFDNILNNDERVFITYHEEFKSGVRTHTSLSLYLVPVGVSVTSIVPSGSTVSKITFSGPIKGMVFTFPNNSATTPTSERTLIYNHSNSISSYSLKNNYIFNGTTSNGKLLPVNALVAGKLLGFPTAVTSPFIQSIDGDFYYSYEVDEPEPPPSSSSLPDPPTPPTPPEPEQPPMNYPTFPKVEGKYIVYDTTIWNKFADDVRSSIGNTVNVGMGILQVLVGIWVTIWIVRRFTGVRSTSREE